MSDDKLTNKILESGFIEAFFDNYYYLKDDKTSSDDRLDFDLCINKKEKIKLTKKKLKECNEIIKKSAHSDIISDYIRDYRSFKSEKEEINVFSNYYKNSITSFEPITNFFSVYDNSLSFQKFYKYNYPEYLQPNIINVEDIWRQEERLLNFFLETIENFEINQIWEIDFDEIYFLIDYSVPIKNLVDLAELYFQVKRMFNYRYLLDEVDNTKLKYNDLNTFSKKIEDFFIKTNYCLVLNPEVILMGEKGNISLVLEPQQFFKLINDYQIDYPFVIEAKIQELKSLMIKENISVEAGISIFESYKNHHNFSDSVLIFQPILDLLYKGLKRINPLITENEITKEVVLLDNFYIDIKKDFHNKMYYGLFNSESVVLSSTKNNEVIEVNSNAQLNSEIIESELRFKIKKHFAFFNDICPRKGHEIMSEEDYNKLIDWTVYFYETKFEVPIIDREINLRTNKTYVISAFKILFKQLNPSTEYPENLFKFYRSISNKYSEDKFDNFLKNKNANEVYKLMGL